MQGEQLGDGFQRTRGHLSFSCCIALLQRESEQLPQMIHPHSPTAVGIEEWVGQPGRDGSRPLVQMERREHLLREVFSRQQNRSDFLPLVWPAILQEGWSAASLRRNCIHMVSGRSRTSCNGIVAPRAAVSRHSPNA